MDKQEPTFESAASGAEAKAEPAAVSKTIDAEAISSDHAGGDGDEKVHNFPLAIYKPSTQYRRFALLAATIALAAAFGGLVGSLSTYGLAGPKEDPAESAHNLQANQQAANLQSALTQVTKDVAALKTSVEASTRTATNQMSKLNDRLDRAQAEPTAKIAALTETVSRLEKRIAANAEASRDITGSIPDKAAAVATAAKESPKQAIVEGWVLREVFRGRAMVENRNALYEVVPGADLPGVGKVQTITQQNGRWVVVTPKGLIVSMR